MTAAGRYLSLVAAACGLLTADAAAPQKPIRLDVDATDTPRKVLHARLQFPAQPGKLTLYYPKWLPGEHAPVGPIADLVGLKMSAANQPVEWRRDPDDMYAFVLQVPAGADSLEVRLDFLYPPDSGATAELVDLNWNAVVLYPKGPRVSELRYAPSLRLPEGWQFGTALTPARQAEGVVQFEPVSLEMLVDSPVIAGAHFRSVNLTPGANPPHFLDIVADSAAALELKPADATRFSRLVAEEDTFFGARHYRAYRFLLTLSGHVAHFGLEHHECSDDRQVEDYLIHEDARKLGAGLLPHEMVHSWNGKYRRPAGLATRDFQQPMNGELLWVYEGLTTYLGGVLTVRSGLWTNENYRQSLALKAAWLDEEAGRTWRPLVDTTVAAQLLYGARKEGNSWRRGTDFYPEGDLIWLEADVRIRQQSHGRHSLDDFCKEFYGGKSGPPAVVLYTFEDVVAALNRVTPLTSAEASGGWRQFFQARVYDINPRAPLGGIEGAGWRLGYTNAVPEMLKLIEGARKFTDLSFSLGLTIKEGGAIQDVIPGSPADKAGVGATMKMVAVNGRRWTPELLRTAIKEAKTNTAPIALLVENEDYFKSCNVDYHEGEKYPVLERDAAKPDLLAEILKPLTP